MMSEHRPDGKITLEDLLRIKQAERPSPDFWASFERELRTRQLAAAVQKPRWWFRIPRAFAGFARYQMPMGAAAVLAVTFLTLREYREPGFEAGYPTPDMAVSETVEGRTAVVTEVEAAVIDLEPVMVVSEMETISSRPEPIRRQPAATQVSGVLAETTTPDEARERSLSPSARSIAVNLAAVEPELGQMLGSSLLAAPTRTAREPLAELTALRDARRQPLFAYNSDLEGGGSDSNGSRATDRIGSRINETELYDSVRRLSGGGDRLTLRF